MRGAIMAVNLIICIAVPLEMLLLYAAAIRLFDIIYPEKGHGKRTHRRQRPKKQEKKAHGRDFSRFEKLL